MHRLALALLLAALFLPGHALAQVAPGEIAVEVADQSPESREQALEAALERALVRVSGLPGIAGEPLLEELLGVPERYLQQFRYLGAGTAEEPLRLLARFDIDALTRALVERGVPVWDPGRPPVLVWLAYESEQGRGLVAEGEDPTGVGAALRRAAEQVGLSVMYPLLDLEDQARVGYADVAGGFERTVMDASGRYGTPLVMMGRVRGLADGSWRGRWSLLTDGLRGQWQESAASREALLDRAARELATRLRPEYAVLPDLQADSRLRVRIEGVEGLQSYADVEGYLAGVTGVAGVALESVDGQTVVFRLALSQPADRVLRELRRGTRLLPEEIGGSAFQPEEPLTETVWGFRIAR